MSETLKLTSQDLAAARGAVTFQVDTLTGFLRGGEAGAKKIRDISAILEAEPILTKEDRYFLGRDQRLQRAFFQAKRLIELRDQHKWNDDEWTIANEVFDDLLPITLHGEMFIPVIRAQGDEEQRKYWLNLAENFAIIGCYAQTEIAHGSNLSGLEVTATYVKETQEFELHTPSITAAKWWIGGLGLAATHAVVQAKLITNGRDFGVHPFVVPLRSLKDHKPFPGVRVADIGPKFGFMSIDNGTVLFDHYRIPRRNMLMGFAKVTEDGQYVPPFNPKIAYGGMVLIRSRLVSHSAWTLAKATTIATRYVSLRRQFGRYAGNVNKSESKDLDSSRVEVDVIYHPMVQYRLFPLIAASYAIHFTGEYMSELFAQLEAGLKRNDASLLPEVHAVSSALKAYCTSLSGDGVEECRKVCGGHGFSASSGFPHMYTNDVATQTYEGENFLLTQQTVRYLLRKLRSAQKQGPKVFTKFEAYLARKPTSLASERCKAGSVADFLDPEVQLAAFGHRAARLIYDTGFGLLSGTGWSDLNIECSRASHAHAGYVLVYVFQENVRKVQATHPALYPILKKVCDLFTLHTMEKNLSEFLEDNYLSSTQAKWVRDSVKSLLGQLRREAIGLVDAWDFTDYSLNSVLGRNDGQVYQSLFDWAMKEPANQGANGLGVVANYGEHLQKILARGRQLAASSNKSKL